MADERLGWDGVGNGITLPPTLAEQAKTKRDIEANQSYGELQQLAMEDQWAVYGASRAIDRMEDFETDPNFAITKEQQDGIRKEFGYEASKEISKAKSEGELTSILSNRRSDIERQQKLASYGMSGVTAQLVAGLFDPVGWGAAILTGGVGTGAKLGQLGRAARIATATGIESAAFEAVMYAGDTQRSVDDVLLAAATGGILGGTVGLATRSLPENAELVKSYDDFDRSLSRETIASLEADSNKAMKEFSTEKVDIGNYAESLRTKSRINATGKQKGMMKKDIRKADDEAATLTAKRVEEVAAVAAKLGAPRNADEAKALAKAKSDIAEKYDSKIADIQAHSLSVREKLDTIEAAPKAKQEYKEFMSMSPSEQRAFLKKDPEVVKPRDKKALKDAIKSVKDENMARKDYVKPMPKPESGGSVGAAKTKKEEVEPVTFEMSDPLETLMYELEDEAEASTVKVVSGDNLVAKSLQSTFATIASSSNPTNKGLALRLLENPQGNTFADKTASILSYYYGKIMRSEGKNRYNDGFHEFLKENKHNIVKGYLNKDVQDEFNKKVYACVVNPEGSFSPAVKSAADGARDQLKMALKLRKEAGEQGFDNVSEALDYMPTIFDGAGMTRAINKYGWNQVETLLTNAYRFGKFPLKESIARKVANLQMTRTMDSTIGTRLSFEKVVSASERENFLEELRKAGVPEDSIEDFALDKEIRELTDSSSNRSKFSLGINSNFTYNGLSVQDVLNTNVPELVENYIKEAAGGAAMAKKGFPTKQSVLNAIDASERNGRNLDLPTKAMQEEGDMLRQSVDLIYGHSIDKEPNASHVVAARRARDYTAIVRLGMVGLASFPEVSRAVAHLGLNTVMKSVPSVGIFRRRLARGGKASGALKEPELREIEELVGYVGEDDWLAGWSVRHDEYGENPDLSNKIGDFVDRAMAAGANLNSHMSGFQTIQGGLEKVVHRGLAKRLKDQLEGTATMPTKALEEAGFDEEFLSNLKKFYDENPKFDEFNGRQVRSLNIEKMDAAMREQLGVGITRMAGRIIQRNFVGETSTWMNTWVGKMFTQFKTFSIASAEKQMIHDLRGDLSTASKTMMFSMMTGMIAYATQSKLRAIGREDEDEYFADAMSPKNLGFGIFGRMPQTASLSLAGDFMASMGVLPESATSSFGSGGFQQMKGVGDIVPSIGAIGDVADLIPSFMNYVSGSDNLSDRQMADKVRRAIPLMGALGTGQLTKAAVGQLED